MQWMNRFALGLLTALVAVYVQLFRPSRLAHAARDNDRVTFKHAPGAASAASTQVAYFVSDRKLRLKSLWLTGINPAAADADTLSVVVDFATDGSAFTACGTVAAIEYNDTDNTIALVALVPNEQIDVDSWTVNEVPAGALVRVRIIWAGTVTDGEVEANVQATTL